jgi:hypothetical protein
MQILFTLNDSDDDDKKNNIWHAIFNFNKEFIYNNSKNKMEWDNNIKVFNKTEFVNFDNNEDKDDYKSYFHMIKNSSIIEYNNPLYNINITIGYDFTDGINFTFYNISNLLEYKFMIINAFIILARECYTSTINQLIIKIKKEETITINNNELWGYYDE